MDKTGTERIPGFAGVPHDGDHQYTTYLLSDRGDRVLLIEDWMWAGAVWWLDKTYEIGLAPRDAGAAEVVEALA